MASVDTTPKTDLLINRDFALLWTGHAFSVLGDFVFETTLVVWIAADLAAGRSWAPLAVSGLLVASAVPTFVVGPVAGVLVDRWRDKRRVMLRADAVSALLILALLPVTGIVPLPLLPDGRPPLTLRLGAIFGVVFLASVVSQFFRPASAVLLRDIVPEALRPRAMGLNQAAASVALLIGPPLAAPLLFAAGPAWALLANAASFFASLLAVRAVRVPAVRTDAEAAATPAGVVQDLLAGLRFFGRSRVLVTVAAALVISVFGLGALNALDVFFVTENLGVPAEYYGVLGAAFGAGMLAGAVLAGWVVPLVGLERAVWGAMTALGLLVLVYARLTSFPPAVAVLFLLGAVVPAINVAVGPVILRETPRAFLGRVSGTINPLVSAASTLGMLLGGVLYGGPMSDFGGEILGVRFGPLDSIFTAVGLLCLLGAAYAFVNLRRPTPPASAR